MKDEIYNEWLEQIQKEWNENVVLQRIRLTPAEIAKRRKYSKERWRNTMNNKVYEIINPIREDIIHILEESNYPKTVKVIVHRLEKMGMITKDDNVTHSITLWLNSDPMFERILESKRKYRYMLKEKLIEEKVGKNKGELNDNI